MVRFSHQRLFTKQMTYRRRWLCLIAEDPTELRTKIAFTTAKPGAALSEVASKHEIAGLAVVAVDASDRRVPEIQMSVCEMHLFCG